MAGQPAFPEIAGLIEALPQDADIAGYSVTNDIEMIEREMRIAGRNWNGTGRRNVDAYRL